MADNQVDLKLNLDFQGVNDALYQMIGQFNGTDKEFQKIANNIQKNAKNLEAAIKLFGPASQQAGAASKKLEKDFQSLVANGIDPASASFKKMTASMPTSAGIDATTGSLRKNNIQWTNLALVIQDLPFGFRGIQNNLPAVAGGFAKMTGPIYLGISALIAVITAWDMGMFKAKKTTDDLKKSQEDLNKALSDSKNDYYANELLLTNYVKIARDANSTDLQRKNAISEVNKVLKDYGIKLDENTIKTGKSEEAIKKVTEAMLNQALIAAYKDDYVQQAKLLDQEKELAGQAKNTAKTAETTSKKGVLGYAALSREIDVTALATKSYNNEAESQWLKQEQKVLDVASGVEKIKKKILELQKIAVAGLLPGSGGGDGKKDKTKDTYAKDFLDALQQEQKLFKDNLDNQLAYAEGNDVKKVELLQKAMSDLVAWHEQGIIEETFYQNTLADLYRQTYNVKQDLLKKEQADKEKYAREALAVDNRQLQNSLDSLKIQSDVATKIANLSNKTNNADRIRILEEYKAALYDLASIGGWTAEQFDRIDDAINRANAAIAGSQEVVKEYEVTWATTVNDINKMVIDLVNNSIFYLAESLGKALAGEKIDVISGLGLLLADSLMQLGKALIVYASMAGLAIESLKNPLKWKIALAAGIAAVAAGAFLKSKLSNNKPKEFANGGIISGPTMGLMGEYPGASHNPEVVAPLDKLKSLIGGGGGTLEARISGNDLLILMNKAGRTNNNTF